MQLEFNEFRLALADDWKQWNGPDTNTLSLYSEQRNAGITLSAQFYEIPVDRLQDVAEKVLESRQAAHAEQFVSIEYLQQSIRPHSTGAGLEIFYAAQAAEDNKTFCFLGYVTSRKILNLFVETSECDLDNAAALFSSVVAGYEPKLP
jgi:hypothetical protein